MTRLHTAVFVTSIALLCALPAIAKPSDSSVKQMAEASATTPDHTSYTQQARDQVQQWRSKLDAFGLASKNNGKAAWKKTSAELDAAWDKAKEASARLETASATEWERAKAYFEKTSHDLSKRWSKLNSKPK